VIFCPYALPSRHHQTAGLRAAAEQWRLAATLGAVQQHQYAGDQQG